MVISSSNPAKRNLRRKENVLPANTFVGTNLAKADMQRELEQMKTQEMQRNTLTGSPVNIQDSAVSGDSLVGSTKIENQTVNDANAIATAAAATAIDAYRMALHDRER